MSNDVSSTHNTLSPTIGPATKTLPGDLAMWFFILMELTVFAILFIAFAVTRQIHPQMFIDGQATLHPIAGLINTIALISSSYMVVLAVNSVTSGNQHKARNYLLIAMLCAVVYLVSKIWEYNLLLEQDFGITTNTFYMLYFFISGFHLMHVLLGMVILSAIAIKSHQHGYAVKLNGEKNISGFEAGASYWHMVDLVWIILFPLIYIVQ